MKKLLLFSVCLAMLSSCGNMGRNDASKSENESLQAELAERDAQLNSLMEAFNEVQEGFRLTPYPHQYHINKQGEEGELRHVHTIESGGTGSYGIEE